MNGQLKTPFKLQINKDDLFAKIEITKSDIRNKSSIYTKCAEACSSEVDFSFFKHKQKTVNSNYQDYLQKVLYRLNQKWIKQHIKIEALQSEKREAIYLKCSLGDENSFFRSCSERDSTNIKVNCRTPRSSVPSKTLRHIRSLSNPLEYANPQISTKSIEKQETLGLDFSNILDLPCTFDNQFYEDDSFIKDLEEIN